MSLLFEDLFKRLCSDLKRQADAILSKVGRDGLHVYKAARLQGLEDLPLHQQGLQGGARCSHAWCVRPLRHLCSSEEPAAAGL